tara:strand:- start:138 stop:542 length:405 start_codon:yes stop_codon:yes gene_type:complete
MSYAKVENGAISKYPYSFADLKIDNPSMSFPRTYLSQASSNGEYNVVEVVDVSKPEKEGFHAEEETPSFDGSIWSQNWKLVSDPVDESQVLPEWQLNRINAYGMSTNQIEFITENGLEAWQTKVAEIKAKYPKS